MEIDLKSIPDLKEKLKEERESLEEKYKQKEEERSKFESYKLYEAEDEVLKNMIREAAKEKIIEIDAEMEELDERRGEIVEKEVSLISEERMLRLQVDDIMRNISNINSELRKRKYITKIRQFEELISKSKIAGASEEVITLLNKQYEELIKERDEKQKVLDELKYEGSIIFDSSKKKPGEKEAITTDEIEIPTIEEQPIPVVELSEPNVDEQTDENEEYHEQNVSIVPVYPKEQHLDVIPHDEDTEENIDEAAHLLDDLNKVPTENLPEENNQTNENHPNNKHSFVETMKAGYEAVKEKMIDIKEESIEKMKKRVNSIKFIPNWLKETGTGVLTFGIVAISYLMASPYITNLVAPVIGASSTLGKNR